MTTRLAVLLALFACPTRAHAQLLPTAPRERCTAIQPGGPSAAEWLERAALRVLPKSSAGRVLRYTASHDVPLWEQSDRMYGPFIPSVTVTTRWYDPATGIEGRHPVERSIAPGSYPSLLYDSTTAYSARDTVVRAIGALQSGNVAWPLENPWIVLAAWRANAAAARVQERCAFMDLPRIVLTLNGERLYLAESDGLPLKLQRVEPHYLWGQVTAAYVWNTWWAVDGGGLYPFSTYRAFDGDVYERIGVQFNSMALVANDSAPRLSIPPSVGTTIATPPAPRPQPSSAPDTVRVADGTYLLVTRAYTETVTLQRDTVFLLDATTSEARARADSVMIATLFPGRHPVVVVVTDLAWPHISGVRFWVARGAIIVSHPASQAFLRRVVYRKWTLNPDALERARASAKFRFRGVRDSLQLGGGALVVYPLQGSTTELAVGVWMPAIKYFWAGDYVQATGGSPYAVDVLKTLRTLHLAPEQLGAQHIKLTPFADFVAQTER